MSDWGNIFYRGVYSAKPPQRIIRIKLFSFVGSFKSKSVTDFLAFKVGCDSK